MRLQKPSPCDSGKPVICNTNDVRILVSHVISRFMQTKSWELNSKVRKVKTLKSVISKRMMIFNLKLYIDCKGAGAMSKV